MSLIHLDGFEDWATPPDGGYVVPVGSAIATLQTGRNTGNSVLVNVFNARIFKIIPAASEHATLIQGYAFKPNADNGNAVMAFRSDAGATLHVYLHMVRGTGALQVRKGDGTTLITSATINKFIRPLSVWYYIELKVTLHDTTGYAELRVNGEVWGTFTGDTKNAGTKTVFDAHGFADGEIEGSSTHNWNVDDYYVLNGAGSAPYNDFLGDVKVETLYPNGNGTNSDFVGSDGNSTDNYLLVDETGAPSMTDYVGSATVGARDLYTMTNLAATAGTIYGVMANFHGTTNDAGARGVKNTLKSGATVAQGTEKALTTTATGYRDIFEADPNTSAAWTVSAVNSLEAGVEVTS